MRSKITLIILSLGLLFSCSSKQKNQDQLESKKLSKLAFETQFNFDLNEQIRNDSALSLYNKAIELDNENFTAYDNKITILSEKKDLKELIKTTDNLIKLRPKKPFYKLQKGMLLLAKGNDSEAEFLFKKLLIEYEDWQDGDLSDFDLNLEYMSALVVNDKFNLAEDHLLKMKKQNYQEFQNKILANYKIDFKTKEKFIRYFNTDISVEDLFN